MGAHPEHAASERAPRLEPLTRLATGGMAEIWLARERGAAGLERFVVIKRLLPHLARDEHIVSMFVSEARFVARLVHPNVVQIHELAEDEQGYFLVMEYVAGCTVRELMSAAIRRGEQLAPEVAISAVEQACRGAHAAHELTDGSGAPLGLVHRDISPHNLMIGPDGDVKLLDFGIAKATQSAEGTHTGSLKGKCGYMSPEQCRAKRLDRRSDVFALGVVLWELLAGKRLFLRESEFASMEAIVSGDVMAPSDLRSDIPAALDAVVLKALSVSSEDRWQTADEMRRALLDAAEASDFRPTRDALAAALSRLLGDRLRERRDALRMVATGANDDALYDALIDRDPSARSQITNRSKSLSDDVATVVQRRVSGTPPSRDDDDRTVARTRSDRPVAPLPLTRPGAPSAADEAAVVARASRRRWLAGAAALVLVAAAAAVIVIRSPGPTPARVDVAADPTASAPAPPPSGPRLRFVVAPMVEAGLIEREMSPYARWLERALDRPVEIVAGESYERAGELVASGEAAFGMLPPLQFILTSHRAPEVRPVVLRLYDGSRPSDGYLLVNDGSELAGAADLKGRKLCLVDSESTTGYLLPRIWLRRAGVDPDGDLRSVLSGDHLSAMRDLIEQRCDAAAVYSGAFLSAGQQGIRVGALRVLAVTGRAPQDVVVAGPGASDAEVEQVRALLLRFEPERDIDAGKVGAVLGISGFADYDAAELEIIREAAEAEGMLSTP